MATALLHRASSALAAASPTPAPAPAAAPAPASLHLRSLALRPLSPALRCASPRRASRAGCGALTVAMAGELARAEPVSTPEVHFFPSASFSHLLLSVF
jgi:hypothetical protein